VEIESTSVEVCRNLEKTLNFWTIRPLDYQAALVLVALSLQCNVFMGGSVVRPDSEKLLLDPRRDATEPFLGLAFKLEASTRDVSNVSAVCHICMKAAALSYRVCCPCGTLGSCVILQSVS